MVQRRTRLCVDAQDIELGGLAPENISSYVANLRNTISAFFVIYQIQKMYEKMDAGRLRVGQMFSM